MKRILGVPSHKKVTPKDSASKAAATRNKKTTASATRTKTTTRAKVSTKTTRAKVTTKLSPRTLIARSLPAYSRYFDLHGASKTAERFKVSPATVRRWRETGIPEKRLDQISEGATRSLQARQKLFFGFVPSLGLSKAAQVLGISKARLDKYMHGSVPLGLMPSIKKKIKRYRARKDAGTGAERRHALRDARNLAKHPPRLPPPKPRAPRPRAPRPKFLPPVKPAKPRKARPTRPPAGIAPEEWDRALQSVLEARAEAVFENQFLRVSPYFRRRKERYQGHDYEFFTAGVRVEEFARSADMERILDKAIDRAIKIVERRPGGTISFKVVGGGNIDRGGNPFYVPLQTLTLGAATLYYPFHANTFLVDTKMPAWRDSLRESLQELLIGPATSGRSPFNNSMLEILNWVPLWFFEGIKITYEPK